jgi:hypothetical protein
MHLTRLLVMEVTEGHRVTLSYNLYHVPGVGDLAGKNTAMDVSSLPLFSYVKEALEAHSFIPQGGRLGIYCRHAYAHTDSEFAESFPGILKGADMAVYNVFRSLGLNVKIGAILSHRRDDSPECYDGSSDEERRGDPRVRGPNTIVGAMGGLRVSDIECHVITSSPCI